MVKYSKALYSYKFMLIDKINILYAIYIQLKTTWIMHERQYDTVNILYLKNIKSVKRSMIVYY